MKKITLFILFMAFSVTYAQKVKVKKGKVLFDNVPVATVDSKKLNYTFASINDNTKNVVVTLERISTNDGSNVTDDWLIVNDIATNRTSRVKMEWYSISMNFSKGIAELLAKKYNIITDNGVENLDDFFNKNSTKDSAANTSSDSEKELSTQRKQEVIEGLNKYGTDETGILRISDNHRIATITALVDKRARVNDFENEKIANLIFEDSIHKIQLFDMMALKFKLHVKENQTLNEKILLFLLESGYTDVLENGIKYRLQQKIEEYEKRLKNTNNITKKKGYGIDKKGNVFRGGVTMTFEDIVDPKKEIDGLKLHGNGCKFALVDYISDNGEELVKELNAKNSIVHIYNDDNKTTTVFKGYKKTEKEKTLSVDSNFNDVFNPTYFHEVVYANDKIELFKNIATPKNIEYGINLLDQENSYHFVTNSERNYNNMVRYLKYNLPVAFKNLNYQDENDLMKIIQFYNDQSK